MTTIKIFTDWLDSILHEKAFSDYAHNGLQVESPQKELKTVAFSVDAGKSVIEKAIDKKSDYLVVHHGLFWGKEQAITGVYAEKINLLLSSGCSLYASHLPLDAHKKFGNNYEFARFLDLEDLNSFCKLDSNYIGVKGEFKKEKNIEEISSKLTSLPGYQDSLILNFGKDSIKTVGIVTGSASSAVKEAYNEELDLFITGEPKQEVYHLAKELKMNCMFVGHYCSETFGVRSLMKECEKMFNNLETIFIDEPTGI